MQDIDSRPFDSRYSDGLQTRSTMIGKERTAASLDDMMDFDRPLQQLLNTYVFNDIWNRPGLPRATRSLIVLAILATLNRSNEFKTHLKAAFKNGVTASEVQELLLQVSVYAGIPAGVEAFRNAKEIVVAEISQSSSSKED